ncbi:NAD(P)H-hydrate dehydratase [Tengunoibacter tsumagoiensis]|uniref:Bifunctional NAD(P)H-hydrate repair enzyme n=1 Tax=Tengunoibacter tsumagoiensis TaxID=2014871 RepID=A0A402A4Y0_9CHLR|nr:NAD(P)H-hydrate dehydratase [Tengunoibacter tsumagoiensis]GCE14160.1 bifunctional ADP-dependent (S)-NAD(P)H-hydrate dehydratase/NAD(P)H-hydrate epimerase [Tengunoibacter tsumagoiensis]
MHIVTIAEMRELEALAEQRYGLTSDMLMSKAGKSAADLFTEHLLPHYSLNGLEVLFLIGPGNNGGDGVVMANHLAQEGALISLYYWKEQKLIVRGEELPAAQVANELVDLIKSADYIVDAILGTGQSRPLAEDLRALLAQVQQERTRRPELQIVAIDLPTGLNADTGEVDPGTLRADTTITLACPKQGFFFFPGRDYIGELFIGDIGLPEELEQTIQNEMLSGKLVHKLLPQRALNSNKGSFGKTMLFAGSPPYPGSAYLAGTAAARVGAGLVTLAVTEKMLPIYASSFHEATFTILPAIDAPSFDRAKALNNSLEGYKVLLIGPGLGQSPNTRETILQVLEYLRSLPDEKRPRLVIDADGLNNLSALERWWTLLPKETVITPHPGEMGRLCKGIKVSGGNIERLNLTRQKAHEWQVNVVLKGTCTIIANPQGQTRINWWGSPALATAGTGDVLAGMISGFLSQGLQPFDAASAGVYLHTAAADLLSDDVGRAGLLASDLLPHLPRTIIETAYAEF